MKRNTFIAGIFMLFAIFSCNTNDDILVLEDEEDITIEISTDNQSKKLKILSLGYSYTIGESVCTKCRFPEQLKDSLLDNLDADFSIDLKVIARTGWTTTNLKNAISDENIASDFDIVTLLIGVNNQFQRKEFSIYEKEFPELIQTAIKAVNNNRNNVIVLSIPDYAFTPFGKGNTTISAEIDNYNNFAKNYCAQNRIAFINITDITRNGLTNTALVASDGLHPSTLTYTKFVERLLPVAKEKLGI